MRRARPFLAGLALAAPFYLLLIDTTAAPEVAAGAVAALLAAGVYELAYAEGAAHASFRLRWLRRSGRVLMSVPPQILMVCAEILAQVAAPRRERGELRTVPFHVGGEDSRDRGRRALTEALGSLAPNTIVIGADPAAGVLLVHQLRHHGGEAELDPLGLGRER
jgi:hypothetical protein